MIPSSNFSFVVQGAIDRSISTMTGKPVTQSCLEGLRQHFGGAEIILSTWQGEDLSGLDYDVVVENEDPGAWNAYRPVAGEVKLDNTNRQIVSSRNGLRRATQKYAAKLRSDMIFSGNSFIQYLDRYPLRAPEWKIFQQRVITCSMWARDPRCPYSNFPLHPPDWVHIGLREDVQLLWDVPLEPQPESAEWFLTRPLDYLAPLEADLKRWDVDSRRYYPEQYLWCTLLRKFGEVEFSERRKPTAGDIALTEISFANNLIILDPDQFPFTNHKYPYPVNPGYRYYRFISHKEWERLYLKHCAGNDITAWLRQAGDPDFYLKWLYIATFGPLQKLRELAAATRLRDRKSNA